MKRRVFLQASVAAALAAGGLASGFPARLEASQSLPRRAIPGTGESLPCVGFGNSQSFRDGDVAQSKALIETLLEFGGSYIDVGGPARSTVGQIARDNGWHPELFLGTYTRSLDVDGNAAEIGAFQAVDGLDKPMDLVLSANVEEYGRHAETFQRLKQDGLARYVGVARHRQSYHEEMMRLMKAGAVDFVQVNYSMLEPEAQERLLPMAQDLGIAILVNRPFVNGAYFPRVKGHELPSWAAEFDCHSWAQFSLKWILAHPAVTCVLTETSKIEHARDNLAGGLGRLPDAETRVRMQRLITSLA